MFQPKRDKLRVLIVDDLASARHFIRAALEADPGIVVVGEATNGAEGAAMAERLKPDVITMDVMMPVMDGCAATQAIMAARPTPIIAVTSLPLADGRILARMLAAGALDIMGKAFGRDAQTSGRVRAELVAKVKAAARARVTPAAAMAPVLAAGRRGDASLPGSLRPRSPIRVVVIAASTGGPGALQVLLGGLPSALPCPVLVVQHIAQGFGVWLADWLNASSALPVQTAALADRAQPGQVYLAPDDRHLLIAPSYAIRLNQALPVGSLRPAADVLFRSASQAFGAGVLGVVLTGMGNDGAEGARCIKDAGGIVLVQDAETSAIFGMPRAAIEAGAADEVLPLHSIAARIGALCLPEAAP